MARVLAIDDESSILESYRMALGGLHEVTLATGGEAGLEQLGQADFEVILLDISMPGRSGLEILKEIRARECDGAVIMVTVHRDVEMVVEAMKSGADDYMTKPFKVSELRHAVERNLKVVRLTRRTRRLESTLEEQAAASGDIVHTSAIMATALETLRRAAPTEASVLITGESGTGKELAAQYVHRHSNRADEPMVTVNCAAIPENLLESELFGHEKGAFSGAIERKIGKFERADRGTIFLDEIATLPLELQSKILRALENRVIERVGGSAVIRLDVRWIAATNRDLQGLVDAGEFREDLFYRLNVISVTLPPLRDRFEDIPLLTRYFLKQLAADLKRPPLEPEDEVLRVFRTYPWPGNVRELRNVLERLSVLEPGPGVGADRLPKTLRVAQTPAPERSMTNEGGGEGGEVSYKGAIEGFRRRLIVDALRASEGNQVQAARRLGLHRNTLLHHLKSLDIRDQEWQRSISESPNGS